MIDYSIEFVYPMPGESFHATDSSESVGTVGTPINMEDAK